MPKPATARPRTFAPKFEKPTACAGCILEHTGVGYVPGCGPAQAPIVLVGEGPWFDEQAHGEPFVGASGSMLTRVLKLIGRQREQYRIDNAIRCSYGAIEKDGRQQDIVERCGYLSETLANPATQVVVPMGGTALKRLLNLHGNKKVRVQDFHGTVQRDPSNSFWVVPSYHPSHLQRGATNLIGVAAFDLSRAQEIVDGAYREDVERLVLDPPVEWFRHWATGYMDAATQDPYGFPLAVDIETPEGTAAKGEKLTAAADDSYQILRVNFSCDPEEGVTVPFEGPYIPLILDLLAAGGVQYYWFKGYDFPRLAAAGAQTNPLMALDIMWAWKALQADLPMGLGHAAPFYCRGGAWKHLAHEAPAKYGAIDGVRTRKVGDGILRDLTAEGREQVFWRHQHRFHAYVLQPATDVGLAIDRPRLSAFKEKLNGEASRLLTLIQAGVPEACRPLTPALGLTREPIGLHTKARAEKRDGSMKLEPPDPIKAEVYKLAVVVKSLVLREVQVCKTCGKIEVAKTHRCQPSMLMICPNCDGRGSGNFATLETVECSFCDGSGRVPLGEGAVPKIVTEVATVTRFFWKEPFNPDSPPQLLALGKACGLDPGKDKHTGNDSVDRETLQRWAKETEGTPVGAALDATLGYKAVAKVRGTYVLGVEKRLDGEDRVHGEFTFKPGTMRLCVAKGTPIEIARDVAQYPLGIPIEDVQPGMLAYTFDAKKKLTLRRVLWSGCTGIQQKVLRLHWMSGFGKGRRFGYLDVTPEHRIRLYDGSYLPASEIRQGHRTLAIVRAVNGYGYARMWASHHRQILEHRFIYETIHGHLTEHVHHLNHQKLDNRPENLGGMTAAAHTSYHGKDQSPQRRAGNSKRMLKAWQENPDLFLKGRDPKLHQLNLSKEWLETELAAVNWHPTKVAQKHRFDYTALMKCVDRLGIVCKRRDTRPDARRNNHLIVFVEEVATPVDVYDLEVEGTHNFVANEICVHNSAVSPNLQNVVADKDGKESLAAGFRLTVVARGREVDAGSEYADV